MHTIHHCPGFEQFRYLKSTSFICPICNKEEEIFSDEIEKAHKCSGCQNTTDHSTYSQFEDIYTMDINMFRLK